MTRGPFLTLLWRAITTLKGHEGAAALISLGVVFDVAYGAVSALAFSWLVDKAIVPRDAGMLWLIVGLLVVGVLTSSAMGLLQDYLMARTGARVGASVRERMFRRMGHFSASYFERIAAGEILSTFSGDVAAIETAVGLGLAALARALLSLIVGLALLYALDVRLAILSTVALPLTLVYARLSARKAALAADERREADAKALGAVGEFIATFETIKSFALERTLTERYTAKLSDLLRKQVRATFLGVMVPRSSAVSINLLELLLLASLATFAFRGYITVGTVLSFHALFMQTAIGLLGMTQVVPALLNAKVAFDRVDAIIEAEATVADADDATELKPLGTRIDLLGVRFGYDADFPVLNGVDLSIRAGERVAFVGPSGSGKSTLGALLLRFFDPDHGEIRFDAVNIKTVTQASLRAQIGYVMQEPVLFDGTLRENVQFGGPEATDQEFDAALRAARVDTFLGDLSGGADAQVGEGGSLLSGGQRQRVAIARALLRKPRVLMLDEATSALDAEIERGVIEGLSALGPETTVLVITHHLRTVAHFDRIFVLDEGRLVQEGKHEALLAQDGVYARLWTSQEQGYDTGRSKAPPRLRLGGQGPMSRELLGALSRRGTLPPSTGPESLRHRVPRKQ
jgi:ATP-binding cassette, subfamily B, bacterial